ncbi:hypothetical protein LINPERHAP1_LOCUS16105, partial [Linum perenne]
RWLGSRGSRVEVPHPRGERVEDKPTTRFTLVGVLPLHP